MFNVDEKLFCPPIPTHDHEHDQGHFPPHKPSYTMTEEMEHTTKEMRSTIERLLRFEERLKEQFEDMLKNITSDNVIFKNTFAESHRTFLEAVKNEINVFEGNVDSSVTLFKQDIESRYSNIAETVKADLDKALADFTETVETNYSNFSADLTAYKTELNSTYEAFRNAIESRLEQHNSTHTQAFNDYVASVNAKLATMEAKFNNDYAKFVSDTNKTITDFKTNWVNAINTRLDGQDSMINDAVLYMKSNILTSIETLLTSMRDSGDLDALLVKETKHIIGNKYFDITRNIDKCTSVFKVDGVTYTSWSDAIADAINKCAETGMEIYFPSGTYYIERPITPLNGTVIKGSNPSSTIIKIIPNTNANAFNLINCEKSGFTLRDICVSGDYDHNAKTLNSTKGVGIFINAGGECDNITIENVVIENFAEHGVHISEQSWVIILSKCVIRRNKKYGLYLDKCSDNMFNNLAIYQNGYGGIYTYLGGNNKYSNLKVYLNSRDCENSDVDEKYHAGISTNMSSLESFVNVEIQENFKHGFMIGGSSDYGLHNILFDANGFENNPSGNYRDLYIWGSRNIHGDVMFSAMKEGRGILDYRIYTTVNTKNIKVSYFMGDGENADGSITGDLTHITSDDTTENIIVTDGYSY